MMAANSVEGRFPFLDHRVVEFCNRLPPNLKLRGLTEKYLLKRLASEWIPDDIWRRPKRPYRAPIHKSFFDGGAAAYGIGASLKFGLVGMVVGFLLSFLFTPVAAQAIAIVGVNPVSGMTLITVVFTILVLVAFGLVMVYSASSATA